MGAAWRCGARNIESVVLERGLGNHVLIAGSAFSLETPNSDCGPNARGDRIALGQAAHIYRGAIVLLTIGAPGLFLATMEDVDAKSLGLPWALAFFALAAAVYGRSFNIEPVITISTHGVHDRRISAEPIPWARIARVEGFDAENVTFVGVDFDDPKVALAHAKPLVRLIAPVHRLFGFPSVTINTSLLDADEDALVTDRAVSADFATAFEDPLD